MFPKMKKLNNFVSVSAEDIDKWGPFLKNFSANVCFALT